MEPASWWMVVDSGWDQLFALPAEGQDSGGAGLTTCHHPWMSIVSRARRQLVCFNSLSISGAARRPVHPWIQRKGGVDWQASHVNASRYQGRALIGAHRTHKFT